MTQWTDKDYEEKRGLVKLGVRVPKELVLEIDRLAKRGRKTRTAMVVEMLEKAVERG